VKTVTERARKLRAQYALQAQGLRSRLEMRVNRIPTALRKRTIQELLDEHAGKETVQQVGEAERPTKALKRSRWASWMARQRMKDTDCSPSDHISDDFGAQDKENAAPAQPDSQDPPVTQQRAPKAAAPSAIANTKAARTASRANVKPLQPSTVLSPKSHNSRTLPRSPFKATSPDKPLPQRPINTAKPPAVRVASRQQTTTAAKKLGNAREREQRSSGGSDSSAGTTIVHKAAAGARSRVAAAAKKTAAVGRAATGKKAGAAAASKKENVGPVTAGGRILRKRG
jgi:hypothetical protein